MVVWLSNPLVLRYGYQTSFVHSFKHDQSLYGRYHVVCLLMGYLLALQQGSNQLRKEQSGYAEVDAGSLKGFGLSFKDFKANLKTIITSLFIGLWIGFLPGMGSGIST